MKAFSKGKAFRKVFGTELVLVIFTIVECKRTLENGHWKSKAGKYKWFIMEKKETKDALTIPLKTGGILRGVVMAKGECWGKRKAEVEAYVRLKAIEEKEK